MHKRTLLAATVLTVVASSSAVATASAATVTVDKACYATGNDVNRPTDKITFLAAGFPADANINFTASGDKDLGFGQVGPDGSYTGNFTAAYVSPQSGNRAVTTLTAATFDGTASGSASFTVTNTTLTQSPAKARPTTRVSFRARGFVGEKSLYAHYTYTKSEVSHPLVKTVKLGNFTGPCGDLDVKSIKQLPLAKLRHKTVYVTQFDTSPIFHEQQGLYFERTVYVP